jgi:nitrilase
MYRAMGEIDCHILPAAFTYTTGKVHWEILLRARAIENQCYFVASAQGGTHDNGRQTWGHSMIIHPWGEINSVLESGEGIITGEMFKANILDVRSKLPALTHRTIK